MTPLAALLALLPMLLPVAGSQAQQAPRPLLPDPVIPPPSAPAPEPGTEEPTGIRREAIAAPSLATVGLDTPRFGFEGPLWPEARGDRLSALIERLPGRIALPALRDLARRLLTVPGPRVADGLALLLARARVLERIGDPVTAAELLTVSDDAASRAARARAALAALAAAGDARACTRAGEPPGEDRRLAAVGIACALTEGNVALADLRLELARERGLEFTPDFLALAAAARDGEPLSVILPAAEERPAVLLLVRRLPVAAAPVAGELAADPAMLAALARNPGAVPAVRLAAAEAAAAAGWLAARELRGIYLDTAGSLAATDVGRRAELVARLAAEKVPAARAALLVEAVPMLAAGMERLLWLRVLAPYAKRLTPDPALDWAASAVLLALLAADERTGLEEWADLLERRAAADDREAVAAARVARLLALAGGRSLPAGVGMPGDRQALLFATLAEGVGLPVPAAMWARLLATEAPAAGNVPSLSLWRELETARREGRPGEGLLAALALLGEAPESAPPLALWWALRGLSVLGEEAVTRATAVQLAIVWRL